MHEDPAGPQQDDYPNSDQALASRARGEARKADHDARLSLSQSMGKIELGLKVVRILPPTSIAFLTFVCGNNVFSLGRCGQQPPIVNTFFAISV